MCEKKKVEGRRFNIFSFILHADTGMVLNKAASKLKKIPEKTTKPLDIGKFCKHKSVDTDTSVSDKNVRHSKVVTLIEKHMPIVPTETTSAEVIVEQTEPKHIAQRTTVHTGTNT